MGVSLFAKQYDADETEYFEMPTGSDETGHIEMRGSDETELLDIRDAAPADRTATLSRTVGTERPATADRTAAVDVPDADRAPAPKRRRFATVTSLVAIAAVAGVLAGYVAVQLAGGWDTIWATSYDGPGTPPTPDAAGGGGDLGQDGSASPSASASNSASATPSASGEPSRTPGRDHQPGGTPTGSDPDPTDPTRPPSPDPTSPSESPSDPEPSKSKPHGG